MKTFSVEVLRFLNWFGDGIKLVLTYSVFDLFLLQTVITLFEDAKCLSKVSSNSFITKILFLLSSLRYLIRPARPFMRGSFLSTGLVSLIFCMDFFKINIYSVKAITSIFQICYFRSIDLIWWYWWCRNYKITGVVFQRFCNVKKVEIWNKGALKVLGAQINTCPADGFPETGSFMHLSNHVFQSQ